MCLSTRHQLFKLLRERFKDKQHKERTKTYLSDAGNPFVEGSCIDSQNGRSVPCDLPAVTTLGALHCCREQVDVVLASILFSLKFYFVVVLQEPEKMLLGLICLYLLDGQSFLVS